MSNIKLSGNPSGSGSLTIAAPNTNSDYTLNLPASSGTVLADGASQSPTFNGVTATTLTVNSNNISAVNSLGFRNRIINGDMRIDQRNAGASVTINISPVYTVDRWYGGRTGTINNFTVQRSSVAPSGFTNSIVITAGTGVTPAANDFGFLSQAIEGFNFADLGWGAAGAQSVTISFWVRSSLTGAFGVGLRNGAANRSYIASYTISAANTWEYKTVSILGDTTGTWATDNTQAVGLFFDVGCGSNFSSTAGSWSSSNLLGGLTGGVKLAATTGATMNITGVQLEAGSVATPFERRPYGTELALCQRYCYVMRSPDQAYFRFNAGYSTSTTQSASGIPLPVQMRTTPSLTASINWQEIVASGSVFGNSMSVTTDGNNQNFVTAVFPVSSGAYTAASVLSCVRINNSTTWYAAFSAEL